jgi:hypothetical protein
MCVWRVLDGVACIDCLLVPPPLDSTDSPFNPAPAHPPTNPPTGFKGQLKLRFTGSAGQSFGAFTVGGMDVLLEGEANDYVGKGMNGGRIVINPHPDFRKRGDVKFTDQVS